MKRILFVSLCTLMLAVLAFSQDKAAQITDLQNQLNAVQQEYVPMLAQLKTLKTDQDNNKFAWDAYKKADDQYNVDLAAFNSKMNEANRAAQLLKPSIDNLKQRMDAHNANQCVEKNHDGSCAWYDREAAQLNANADQVEQAKAQVRAQYQALAPESQRLDTTLSQLKTIYSQAKANDEKWQASMAQLKSQYLAVKVREDAIKAKLAALHGTVDQCFRSIPAKCQSPAIGPDGKPILDQNCEDMVAQCRAIFDGSKP
jgi:chromosome segregation ATPase